MLNPHAHAFTSAKLPPPPVPRSPVYSDEDLDFRPFLRANSESPTEEEPTDTQESFITNDSATLQAFLSESPYSFRNPIFFSVPVQKTANMREPKASRKLLFQAPPSEPRPMAAQAKQRQDLKEFFNNAAFNRPQQAPSDDIKENASFCRKAQTPGPTKTSFHHQFRNVAPRTLFPEPSLRARQDRLRSELEESPRSKAEYRDFSKVFKEQEKRGFVAAREYTLLQLFDLPEKVHYRALLDLAELAKRESKFEEARLVFKLISHIQPFAYQSWLECSKMEEQCGNLPKARKLLRIGLKFQPLHQNLFTRALKLEEKLSDPVAVRSLLASLAQANPRTHYRLFIEAAFFQARAGRPEQARLVFKYLIAKRSSHLGPIYHEYVRMEARLGNLEKALALCVQGLSIPYKHTPLCFEVLRVAENLVAKGKLAFAELEAMFGDCLVSVQNQSYWKICLEIAQIYARAGQQQKAEQYVGEAAFNCNESIVWKVWVYAARIKVRAGQGELAQRLLSRACDSVQHKQTSIVLLELAKFHEFKGDLEMVRKVLGLARAQAKTDWKIFFESILAETRQAKFGEALKQVKAALEIHFATGRIWASYVHLLSMIRFSPLVKVYSADPFTTFKQALYEIPKSGEVWCEGARLRMDPYAVDAQGASLLDFSAAKKCLKFAIQFTPQYGDSFLEMLRLLLLEQALGDDGVDAEIEQLRVQCVHSEPNYGCLWFYCREKPFDSPHDIWQRARGLIELQVQLTVGSVESALRGEQLASSEHWRHWTAVPGVNEMFRGGLGSGEQRWQVVYGNEPIYT